MKQARPNLQIHSQEERIMSLEYYYRLVNSGIGKKVKEVLNGLIPGLIPEPVPVRVPVRQPERNRRNIPNGR